MTQEVLTNLDDSTNDGSVVGLPVDAKSSSSSSSDEEDSPDAQVPADANNHGPDQSLLPKDKKGENVSSPFSPIMPSPMKENVAGDVCVGTQEDLPGDDDINDDDDTDEQPKLAAVETSSTPSPPPPNINYTPSTPPDHNPAPSTLPEMDLESSNSQQMKLEERVQELEAKLATLSRLLQQQQRLSTRSLLLHSPSNSQRSLQASQKPLLTPRLHGIPLMEDIEFRGNFPEAKSPPITDSPPLSQGRSSAQKGMVPYLESPAPIEDRSPRQRSLHQRKRLSFHLLYDGNEENLSRADDDNDNHHVHAARMAHDLAETTNGNNFQNDGMETLSPGHPLHDNIPSGLGNNRRGSEKDTTNKTALTSQSAGGDIGISQEGIADVAARVVSAQTKAEAAAGLLDSSHTSVDSSSTKKQSTVASPSCSKDVSEETSSTPSGGRPILPPLLLSKDMRRNWLDHLNSFQESNDDVDIQMQEFIKVPGAVEKTLISGFLMCVDSFLYVCTILPIRFVWSCVLLSLHYFFKWTKKPPGNYQFHRRHTYQLIQVSIILFIYTYILLPISIGKLYHWIRGQAMIKLYVLIAMVEVFDRLMCSLGQDCLDSLYWNTTRRPRSSRMLISVSVVMVYTAVHSLILFIHVCTLSVAMNSADEALLALLIGGNFAEIKSTVFKKYNKPSLFKIVASDICERFKLALFLSLVLLLNFCQGMDSRKMSDYQRIAGTVWMSELLCDWLKHAFITKFNFIPSTVYPEYGLLLAGDVTGIGHEGVNLDRSHAFVKRVGFAQMPLVCVMARLVTEAAKYMSLRIDSKAVPSFVVILVGSVAWIVLLLLKICLGAYLQHTSLAKLHAAPELTQTPLKNKQKQH